MTSKDLMCAVFNFYETITPPLNYPSFTEGWKRLGCYVETLDHYVCAQLHRNMDEKGLFPYVNFSTFTGTFDRIIKDFMEPSPELIKAVVEGHGMPGSQVNHPGGYEEIATLDGERIIPDLPPKLDSLFIISAYTASVSETEISNMSELEKTWQKWAGIHAIRDSAPSWVTLGKAGLYKRFTPGEPFKAVIYTVRCELLGLKEDSKAGSDFVNIIRNLEAPEGLLMVNSALYCLEEDLISLPAKSK